MTIAAEPLELTDSIENSVRRMSEPSKLQITDIRARSSGSTRTRASTASARCVTAPIPTRRFASSIS